MCSVYLGLGKTVGSTLGSKKEHEYKIVILGKIYYSSSGLYGGLKVKIGNRTGTKFFLLF